MAGLIPNRRALLVLLVLIVLAVAASRLFCTGYSDSTNTTSGGCNISTPTVPNASTPTVPNASTPTVPNASTPTVPNASTPTVHNPRNVSSGPYSWATVLSVVKPGSPACFLRSRITELKYAEQRDALRWKKDTLENSIKKNIFAKGEDPAETCFSIGSITDAAGSDKNTWSIFIQYDAKWRTVPWVEHLMSKNGRSLGSPSNSDNAIVIARNLFPYDFEPGISHWVIWGSSKIPESTISGVAKQMCTDFPFVWYENSPSVKSIPGIFCVHLLVNSDKNAEKPPAEF